MNNHLVHPHELGHMVVHQGDEEGQLEDKGQLKDKKGQLRQLESKEGKLCVLQIIDTIPLPI